MSGKMRTVICKRSGLEFQTAGRLQVHPEISEWTADSDWNRRKIAVSVIERGKAEGWNTLEKFQAEIWRALAPAPEWNFSGKYAARIVGADDRYRFKREFLPPVGGDGPRKLFFLPPVEGAVYETCYVSRSGNQTRDYWVVREGKVTEVCLDDVEKLFPAAAKTPDASPRDVDGVSVSGRLGERGAVIRHEGIEKVVVALQGADFWEDCDGVERPGTPGSDAIRSWTEWVTVVRPATAAEIEADAAARERQARRKAARERLLEIFQADHAVTRPENAPYPTGVKIPLREGHFQTNQFLIWNAEERALWNLSYNGRDGDDWSANNVAGAFIGHRLDASEGLAAEIEVLTATLAGGAGDGQNQS